MKLSWKRTKFKAIAFIGMPGSGKSFLGKKLAKKLNWKLIDTDKLIEKDSDKGLQAIFDKNEKILLRLEEQKVLSINNFNKTIVSTGGSVCYSDKAMKFLRKNSLVVFLDADLKLIKKNLKGKISNRGIIGLKNNSLEKLYYQRLPLYKEAADVIIKIKNQKQAIEKIDKLTEIIK